MRGVAGVGWVSVSVVVGVVVNAVVVDLTVGRGWSGFGTDMWKKDGRGGMMILCHQLRVIDRLIK